MNYLNINENLAATMQEEYDTGLTDHVIVQDGCWSLWAAEISPCIDYIP